MPTLREKVAEAAKNAMPWLDPMEIEKKIARLSFEHQDLNTKYLAAAYRAESNFPGAASERDALMKARDETGQALEHAKAAMHGAEEARRHRLMAKADADLQKRNAKILKRLDAREAAAKQIADGIAVAVTGWNVLVSESREIGALAPNLLLDHGPDLLGTHRLRALVEVELHRQGGTDGIGTDEKAFPGGRPHPELLLVDDPMSTPSSLPPLVANIGQLNSAVTQLIDRGQV